ncbi:hypothetical protein H5410_001968 [Solanum commersonii]|uniref:G-patch domain-containing protein n=1 Tax=Solanum commersonii TaxID=4109 RepID=A0A9J6B128_SOLCO|nr:hypothetical protein H5410_001968 [Solanum commersonii]
MSCAAIMVAKEMLRNGYQPRLGLGKTLNGRVEPVADDIIDGIQSLFLEDEGDHDVVIEDISETPIMRIVESRSELKNWIYISTPVRWEFQ